MAGFKKAVREDVWLKIGMTGTSGSGKTFSALRVATGLVGKCDGEGIAFISTEKSRSLYYADRFSYDVLELDEYGTEDYINAIKEAVNNGYKVIIIDSLSHGWMQLNEDHSNMKGNSFQNWGVLKPKWKKLMNTILSAPAHVFVLTRGKTEWTLEDKNGKSVPTKVGLGSTAEKDQDFEYTVSFMLNQGSHVASVDEGGKDNTGLYDGKYRMLTEEDGVKLYNWANAGENPSPLSKETMNAASNTPVKTDDELKSVKEEIIAMCTKLGGTKNEELMTTLKNYVPSGNPNAFRDIDKAKECLEKIKAIKPIA